MAKTHFNIKITGKVQGVSFRAYVKKKANELN
ncbi:MAG: acylphosphatase, partial [Cytophagales bacterium]